MKFRKTAFTLVELLVVVSIISIFASLLLPAVQKSREAARREACINNCEQLCLGLHKFENVHGRIPGGNTAPVNSRLTNYFGPQLLLLGGFNFEAREGWRDVLFPHDFARGSVIE